MKKIIILSLLAAGFWLTWLVLPGACEAQNLNDLGPQNSPTVSPDKQNPVDQMVDPLSEENLKNVITETKLASPYARKPLTETEASQYTLGPDDIIEITVMRHPEVSGRYLVNSEGKIQYEFVGDIVVKGKTKDETATLISGYLKEYIVAPDVNVKIAEYNSKVVFVVGEVGHPGKVFMRGDTIKVREALMEAGLPLLSGVTKKSRLITPAFAGKMQKRNVDVYALLYEGDLRQNLDMKPGDVLYIPPTFLTKTMRAISPVTEPLGAAAGTGRSVVAPYP